MLEWSGFGEGDGGGSVIVALALGELWRDGGKGDGSSDKSIISSNDRLVDAMSELAKKRSG